jgi:hypothetical protein
LVDYLVWGRQNGVIEWEWIEDRLRQPLTTSMWGGIEDFGRSVVPQYRRDVWAAQPEYVEVCLEKDALSGIFEDVLRPYRVTLNIGRGYDSWSAIKAMADRLLERADQYPVLLFFTDFDPSGEGMVSSYSERLNWFAEQPRWSGLNFEIKKLALTAEDARGLPTIPTKERDTRREAFIEEHGDNTVELDALPVEDLRQRIIDGVEAVKDLGALEQVKNIERSEREEITRRLGVTD